MDEQPSLTYSLAAILIFSMAACMALGSTAGNLCAIACWQGIVAIALARVAVTGWQLFRIFIFYLGIMGQTFLLIRRKA